MSLEKLLEIHESIKKRNLQVLSKGIEELRSGNLLTDESKTKIEGWIEENFPISMVSVAKSLLESEEGDEEGDEKEREEKIPPLHPQNICSSDTQNDLLGGKLPSEMEQVITFLLPKSKKSECVTEKDLSKIVGKREDEIYLYDSSKKQILTSVIVYRLPASGIWIVGHPIYFRIFRAYQLESFGKHTISVQTHRVGSVWRQEHELFLAKPLHWNDFTSFIRDNVSFPATPSACACMFKPEEADWSVTAKNSLPVKDCHWMIPTWNGIPIFLGETCVLLLNWASIKLIIPDIQGGNLTKLPRSSIESINELITSLAKYSRDSKLYIRTDRNEKVRVTTFSHKFVWLDPEVKIGGTEYIGEVSARFGKWPTRLEIQIDLDRSVKGKFIELVTENSFLHVGQTSALTGGEVRLDWMLDITEILPERLISPLPTLELDELHDFSFQFTIEINRSQLFLIQGSTRIEIDRQRDLYVVYADGSILDANEGGSSQMAVTIRDNIKIHGPPVRLKIGFRLSENLPESDDPVKVVGREDKIMLPLTKTFEYSDDKIILTYIVDFQIL